MRFKLTELSEHPDNNQIYSKSDLTELKDSILEHGQLEPLVITKDKVIISGHRRFNAMKEIGLEDCEARIENFDNDVVALIQFNKQRQKTNLDFLNESKMLEKELQKQIGRGRWATKERKIKMKTVDEVAKRVGTNASHIQKLNFLDKHDATYLYKVDRGEISLSKAVQEIKEKLGENTQIDSKTLLRKRLLTTLKDKDHSLEDIMASLKSIFPYSLELTNTSDEKRKELEDELNRLRKMDSKQYMYYRKFCDLSHLNYKKTDKDFAKSLIPTLEELKEWVFSEQPLGAIEIIDTETDKKMSKQLWSIFRHHISSAEYNSGRGRFVNFFILVKIGNKKKLLGIATLGSDIQGYTARDSHIGWSNEVRAKRREFVVNMRVSVPTQPFGFNFLGGKLISLLMSEAVKIYEKKYDQKVVAVVTTSLHGSFSQYSGLKNFKSLGKTKGEVIYEPKKEIFQFWHDWLQTNFQSEWEYSENLSNIKNYRLTKILTFLGLDIKRYQHSYQRGVFMMPLYKNYIAFLNEEISERQLIPETIDIEKWVTMSRKRFKTLNDADKLDSDILFIESEDYEYYKSTLKYLD